VPQRREVVRARRERQLDAAVRGVGVHLEPIRLGIREHRVELDASEVVPREVVLVPDLAGVERARIVHRPELDLKQVPRETEPHAHAEVLSEMVRRASLLGRARLRRSAARS
jgi:hypothetical protein